MFWGVGIHPKAKTVNRGDFNPFITVLKEYGGNYKMKEVYYINGKAYILRFYNGIHCIECEGRIVFEGWYEKCKAVLKDIEVAHLETLL